MQVTVTFDPTKKAVTAGDIAKVLRAQADALDGIKTKRGKPGKTVSPDEDEDFGTKPLKKKDVEEEEEGDESEEEEDDESEDSDTDESDSESDEDEEEDTEDNDDSEEDEDSEEEPETKKTRGKKRKDDDDEESNISFDEVKEVMNKYGNKYPDQMKNILLSFNIKTTKELKANPKKWEPVFRKVKAALAKLKKGK